MSTKNKNLSAYSKGIVTDISNKNFAIVVSEWNDQITDALFSGTMQTMLDHGADKRKIKRIDVPGSYELPLGAQWMAEKSNIDAVICLGCIIQGETPHFDFISQAVAQGIKDVGLKFNKPVVFGVLTTNNMQQALDRAGGKHGNKGDEAAITAIKMLSIQSINIS